ncbi:hypothetical protein HYH02_003627 [Chlamydomonas schloesseri]|uniref:Protein kinase domain-containing protein n=1 Tax=Chlamydomonas schloesseri TaxID=2026947 RepID=A0A836B9J4_9CHLO|nr:hypothetical protein HYH02_003627 [Chlamydomonas schloesseri]|eukprot:KAG2451851.1 hypothetical protein HYH02_003627 [Chlamydomonas schloesseri]
MHASALAGVVRPPAYPGTQAYRALLLQPTCDAKFVNAFGNGSSSNTAVEALKAAAPPPPPPAPQLRCWSHMGAYDNLGIFCADLDASQKQVLTGYTLLMTNVTYVCDDIITDECVARLGTVGCYNNWADYKAQQLALAPSPPLAASDGGGISINATLSGSAGGDDGGSSGGGSGGLSDTEQVLVGAIIGGVGGALLIGAVLGFFVWRRRKAAREVPQLPVADKGNATAGAAGASGFTNLDVKSDGGSAWALCPPFTRVRRADSRYAVPPACAIGKQRQDWLYSSGAPAMGSSSASEGLPGATADVMSSPSATEQQLSRLPDRLGGASSRSELDGACASVQDAQHDSDEGLEMAGIYETVEVVTLDTPQRVEVKTDVLLDPTVTLLPKQLGRGTFGRVLEGRYQGQKVAVKLLNESAFGVAAGVTKSTGALPGMRAGAAAAAGAAAGGMDKGGNGGEECGGQTRQIMLDALVQEVEVLGRCRHPNVVRLLAACLTPPRLCLVMELMETSLERMLYGGGPEQPLLPLGTVLDIALDVAQGLSYLHPTIVHRDLKPGNVLVNLNGGKRPLAKLSDFGLSRIHRTIIETSHPEAGTPAYMAPELFDIDNFSISPKVDVYSYAILVWSMLSGQEPWKELTLVQMAYGVAVLHERPPLSAIPADRLSPKMIRLITSCWDPEPERRPAAAEVAKQLLLIKQDFGRNQPGAEH